MNFKKPESGGKMNISVSMEMPTSTPERKLTSIEKAQKLIDKIENPDADAETEWEVLKETYKRLEALPKRCGEMKNLFDLIFPVIEKYSRMDPKDGDLLNTDTYMQWMEDHDPDFLDQEDSLPPINPRG